MYGHLYIEMQNDGARIMDGLIAPIKVNLAQKKQEILG
jgi:hypothetical protein